LPASSRRPAMTSFAPFLAKAMAAARPMPVKAPVTYTTGLLIFGFLMIHGSCRRSMDRPAGKLLGSPQASSERAFMIGQVGTPSASTKDFIS
jgi:hypothetical protein